MPNNLTKEQQEDVNKRTEEFRKKYAELVNEFQCDFYSYPQFVPAPTGAFEVACHLVVFDKKYLPVPSPLGDDILGSSKK